MTIYCLRTYEGDWALTIRDVRKDQYFELRVPDGEPIRELAKWLEEKDPRPVVSSLADTV